MRVRAELHHTDAENIFLVCNRSSVARVIRASSPTNSLRATAPLGIGLYATVALRIDPDFLPLLVDWEKSQLLQMQSSIVFWTSADVVLSLFRIAVKEALFTPIWFWERLEASAQIASRERFERMHHQEEPSSSDLIAEIAMQSEDPPRQRRAKLAPYIEPPLSAEELSAKVQQQVENYSFTTRKRQTEE